MECLLTHVSRQFLSDEGNELYDAFLKKHAIEDDFTTELDCYEEIRVQLAQDTFEAGREDSHTLWDKVFSLATGGSSDQDEDEDAPGAGAAADFPGIFSEHVGEPDCHTRVGGRTVEEFAKERGLTEKDAVELEEIINENCESTGSTDDVFLEKTGKHLREEEGGDREGKALQKKPKQADADADDDGAIQTN